MIPASEVLFEAVFQHIDETDGTQTVIAVDRLMRDIMKAFMVGMIEPFWVNIEQDHAQFCRVSRGIEQHRLDRLTDDDLKMPMIFCDWPKNSTQLLADGHHRYVKHAELGHKEALAFVVPKEIWERYTVSGAPQFSEEELKTMHSGYL